MYRIIFEVYSVTVLRAGSGGFKVKKEWGVVKEAVRQFYQRYPCGGDWTGSDGRHAILGFMEREFRYGEYSGKRVLDVGCGTGIDLARYAGGGAVVVGVDFTLKPLKLCAARVRERGLDARVHLVRADAEALPFRDCAFDFAYSNGVLHHLEHPGCAVGEVRRCLRGGAGFVALLYQRWSAATLITLLNRLLYRVSVKLTGRSDFLQGALERLMRRPMSPALASAFREMWEHPLIRYYTKKTARALFGQFSGVRVRAYDPFYPLSRLAVRLRHLSDIESGAGRILIARGEKRV